MRTLLRLLCYAKPYGWYIAAGLACLLIAQPLQLLHPLFWKFVVDEVLLAEQPRFVEWVGESRVALLLATVGAMFAAYAGGAAVSALRGYVLGVAAQKVGLDIRNDLYRRMQDHALRFFHEHRSGDLVARVTGDVDNVQQLTTSGVDELIGSITQLIMVWLIILFIVSWHVALALLVPMGCVALLVFRYNTIIRPLYRRIRDRLGDVSAKVQENLLGMLVIKAFGRERREAGHVEHETRRYYDEAVAGLKTRTKYMPAIQVIGFSSNVIMLAVGGYFVLRDQASVGDIVALRGYWWYLFAPVWSLARINDLIQRSLAAASRIFDVIDEPIEIVDADDAETLDSVDGRIECRHLTFAHTERQTTLSEVNFVAEPGQSVGLAGPSGAGKSTLLSLLLRLYDPNDGAILLDGRDLRRITQPSLRQHFAIVAQEPFLFNHTIRSNVLYADPDASEEAMHDAARLANAHDFILGLPKGYDTLVGERGVKLSGGQKQRICIARAFLANPEILLLDEATASVEPESEAIIQAALSRLMEGRTAVIVSHRLSMIRDCDQILVMEDGRVTERGGHEQLMAAGRWYARMYRLQTTGE